MNHEREWNSLDVIKESASNICQSMLNKKIIYFLSYIIFTFQTFYSIFKQIIASAFFSIVQNEETNNDFKQSPY